MRLRRVSAGLVGLLILVLVSPVVGQQLVTDSIPGVPYRFYDNAIDPDKYLIRPGEVLTVQFIGTSLPARALTVNAEGLVVDPNMGVIDLTGRTLSEARDALKGSLEELYTADRIEISPGKPVAVSITVTGAVQNPGRYTVYTSYSAGEVLELAGGISSTGSRRHIELLGGPAMIPVDLDRALYLGDDDADPYVYAGRRIHVPESSPDRVYVLGEVHRPREIELKSGDTPEELIRMAGGLTARADTSAIDMPEGTVKPGDVIKVPSLAISGEGHLLIFGAITFPGDYQLESGMTLGRLIEAAGGVTERANRARITVFRLVPEEGAGLAETSRYPITVADDPTFNLRIDDSVFVPTTLGFVRVEGSVRNPGLVPYRPGSSAQEYIRAAGGYLQDADRENLELTDRVSRITSVTSPGAIVHDGDVVTVPRRETMQ